MDSWIKKKLFLMLVCFCVFLWDANKSTVVPAYHTQKQVSLFIIKEHPAARVYTK